MQRRTRGIGGLVSAVSTGTPRAAVTLTAVLAVVFLVGVVTGAVLL